MAQPTSGNKIKGLSPIGGLLSSASDVALDIIEVSELQLQLAGLDAKSAMRRSVAAFSLVFGGIAITIACLPLVAIALSTLLSEFLGWELWISQLVVGLLSTIIGLSLTAFGAMRLWYAISAFERTSTEFTNNMSWLKQLVRGLKSSNFSNP